MSSEKPRIPNYLVPKIKDSVILVGWISGLILIASLCWFFTQPARSGILVRAINKVLEQSGDSRRLGESFNTPSSGMGSWYTLTENSRRRDSGSELIPDGTRAYVFIFIGEGSFFPCAAVVSPEGKVEEFIPLNDQGKRMIKRVPPGVLKIYSSRIEGLKS